MKTTKYELLHSKYKNLLRGLAVITFMLAFVAMWFASRELAEYLGLSMDESVKDNPNGWLWFWTMIASLVIFLHLSFVVVFSIAAVINNWTVKNVLDMYLQRDYPKHWFK